MADDLLVREKGVACIWFDHLQNFSVEVEPEGRSRDRTRMILANKFLSSGDTLQMNTSTVVQMKVSVNVGWIVLGNHYI